MSKYFSTTIVPDIIDGDVSDIVGTSVGSDAGDVAFGANDILFDWTSFEIPRGASKLTSIMIYMMGEDGGVQNSVDIGLLFAKTENEVAPTSLGETNAAQTAGFDMPTHLIGATTLNVTADDGGHVFGPAFGGISVAGAVGANEGGFCPVILQGEPNTGTTTGYDKIYVAAFCKAGIDFSTGVKPDAVAATSTDTISVDGVDPRKCFQIGDTVYTNTDDTPLGTVKSMSDDGDSTYQIVLNANLAAQVEDNEEIVNANPIRITFGFEQ